MRPRLPLPSLPRRQTGADELRRIVVVLNCTRESALDPFTAEELITLVRAQLACAWDHTIEEWTPRQITEALEGKPPRWDDRRRPVYK